jgi:hypothetical protein
MAALALLAIQVPRLSQAADGRTLHVPAGYPRLEDAITASVSGDVILIAPGTYPGGVVIPEDRPGITIRGEDRNTVVFDGEYRVHNAIEVEADGVTVENMTAHSYVENGFYWDGVDGYVGRYLTVWNVGLYAIYAIESRNGILEHSYASGAADAAFYIGECNPCDATIRNVTAARSAVGYSGTNAGGNLVVEDSRFENNGAGILPNSFEVGLEPPPQRDAIFRRNVVTGSGSVPTPRATPLGGFQGIGIGVLGGIGNLVEGNQVTGSTRYGIAVFTAIDREATWEPSGNRVAGNTVSGSGTADLALAAGAGAGNCFESNHAATVLPPGLTGCWAAGEGSQVVADEIVLAPPDLIKGLPEAPSYTAMPPPSAQPTMPPPPGAAADAALAWLVAVGAVLLAVIPGAVVWVLIRRRRRIAQA